MYVKLFGRMLRSSIMDEDVQTRWAFVVMLLSADREGVVYGTANALSRTANMSETDFLLALERLMAPDPCSTTPDEDGRRIVCESPNVWRVVNYRHYREAKDEDGLRASTRERVRACRERKRNEKALHGVTEPLQTVTVTECNSVKRSVTLSDAATDPCSEADAETDKPISYPSGTLAPSPRKAKAPKHDKFRLDTESWEWVNITPDLRSAWVVDYPGINIEDELRKARAWVRADPTRKKTNWTRFIAGWFSRAQDKCHGIGAAPAVTEPDRPNAPRREKEIERVIREMATRTLPPPGEVRTLPDGRTVVCPPRPPRVGVHGNGVVGDLHADRAAEV